MTLLSMADPPLDKTPYVTLENIHKQFGSKKVLQGFDLEIMRGESVVIIGGSGTGKSVLLKCILGLLQPDQGTITIDGKTTAGMSQKNQQAINRRIGMLFQNAALFDSLPVWENVAFGLLQGDHKEDHKEEQTKRISPKRISRQAAMDIAISKLELVGLGADVARLYPDELSGGMRKRVGLARAIADDPDLILFDEPTTGLDPIMGHVIDDLIVKLVHELGATALSITHDMASARRISDRMAMLYQGRCIWQGATGVIDETDNPYVHQFITGSARGPIQMEVRHS